MSNREEELDDEALAHAAGGAIHLMNQPNGGGGTANYTYNSTIYFQM